MNKDIYNQPFCIINSKGKFAECYGRYLPPLPHIDMKEKPPQDVEVRYIHHNVNDTRRVFAKLNALDGAVKYLLDKQAGKGKKYQGSYF